MSWVKRLVHDVDHAPFSNLSAYLSYEEAVFFFTFIDICCIFACMFAHFLIHKYGLTYIYVNFCTWGSNVALFLK